MTSDEALVAAYERAAGVCECIGGGCPSLTHRPGINRCSALLTSLAETGFFAATRFADRTDPDNMYALCDACAESPRRQGQRVAAPASADVPPRDAQT